MQDSRNRIEIHKLVNNIPNVIKMIDYQMDVRFSVEDCTACGPFSHLTSTYNVVIFELVEQETLPRGNGPIPRNASEARKILLCGMDESQLLEHFKDVLETVIQIHKLKCSTLTSSQTTSLSTQRVSG